MTLTATKAAFRGFRNGLKQVKMGDYEACIADLWAALGINNRNSFYCYRDGKQEPRQAKP